MAAIGTAWATAAWVEAGWVTEAWSDAAGGGSFVVTRFYTDSGNLARVLAAMEVKLETITNTKTLRLLKIERLSIGSYRGVIVYDT